MKDRFFEIFGRHKSSTSGNGSVEQGVNHQGHIQVPNGPTTTQNYNGEFVTPVKDSKGKVTEAAVLSPREARIEQNRNREERAAENWTF